MKILQKSPPKSPPRSSAVRARARRPHTEMPHVVAPMLATLSAALPADPANYAFEYKWDGVRALLRWDGNDLSVASRNLLDITPRYPEIHAITDVFGSRDVILDGEVIALDDAERPSFSRLQQRMHVRDAAAVRHLMKTVPVFYVVFDIVWLDGRSLVDRPWIERRDRLEELELAGPAWLRSPAHVGEGADLLAAARAMELEGIVAKHIDAPYRPGARSPEWLKIKIVSEQEYVVGGWVPEAGTRTNRIGSLLLGYYDAQGRLRFAGGVGTGFDDEDHRTLAGLMRRLGVPTSPFAGPVPKRGALYVKPETVVQIEYRRKGPEGIVQQAAFKGFRDDKEPREVTDVM